MFDELLESVKNTDVFTQSLELVKKDFSFSKLVMYVLIFFMFVGAIDKIRGNKKGYGDKFDEGFITMGPLAISMVGIISLTPVLKQILQPIISPIYKLFGASPAMFAGTILANDAGAYSLAKEIAENDVAIGNFSGLILGSMMGVMIVGIIPLALSILEKKDLAYFSAGVLMAIITIPLGSLVGGLLMNLTGFSLSLGKILINLIPVVILAILIAVGMWLRPQSMMKGFSAFGNGVIIMITIGTAIAIFQQITDIRLPLFYLMVEPAAPGELSPLKESLLVVGEIGLVLTGTFPFIEWLTRTFSNVLNTLGKKLNMNEAATAGFIATLASIIPTFNMVKDMDPKGKLLNISFGVSAAWVLGDHLGFTAGVAPDMILPVVIGKMTAGLSALWLANKFSDAILPRVQSMKLME
ncbi:ethanolamine utilization protein EutH [Vagococcus elongatus]|uniref:Ethanolamine utilization protein EutH n=1 Tax=Vagococcus elongatus TaxID=180344 RepID=A0A430B5C5_9ENTE|nr:ethanolamine utilization protein EutH [Vagococcus elongatus]RSU15525.1 ethanolamine utilization protein EutH [Vagococcus elongatus]